MKQDTKEMANGQLSRWIHLEETATPAARRLVL